MRDYFSRSQASPLGRMDVRLKMAMGFAMSLLAVLADGPGALGGLVVAAVAIFALCRPNRSQRRLVIISCLLMVWGMMFSQSLFYSRFPRHALIVLVEPNALFEEGLKIYAQGVYYGLIQSMRFVAMAFMGYAICFSTQPDRFLRGLLAIRVPFSLAFMAVSALRFIPVVAEEFRTVRRAMRLKGYRPFGVSLRDTIVAEVSSLRPVLAGAVRRSQEMALSIVTRGFAFGARRTSLYETPFSARQWLALLCLAGVVTWVSACKLLFWLYQQEIYYSAALRPVYAFTRDWL